MLRLTTPCPPAANYFTSIEAALGHSPYWITAKSLATQANILPALEGQAVTLLVPDNAAFKPMEEQLSVTSVGRVADLLKYHVLPKVRRVPQGFAPGVQETLLEGHAVDVNVTE